MDGSGNLDLDSAVRSFSSAKITFADSAGYTQYIYGTGFSGVTLNRTLSAQSFSKLKGKVTSAEIYYQSQKVLSFSGLNETLSTFARKFTSDSAADTAYFLKGNDQISGDQYDDIISGFAGNDKLFGKAGNDTIDGGAGSDEIDAGPGNDDISTGTGTDTITTGSGRDIVRINNGNQLTTIIDFKNSYDTIDLNEFGISSYGAGWFDDIGESLSITKSGLDTVISDPERTFTIVLVGINPNSIDWDDFE